MSSKMDHDEYQVRGSIWHPDEKKMEEFIANERDGIGNMPFLEQFTERVTDDEEKKKQALPEFHIIDFHDEKVEPIKCKKCGSVFFYVAQGGLHTVAKCINCHIEITVHEG